MATPTRARAVFGYLALTASLIVLSHSSYAASGWLDRLKAIFGGDESPAAGALTTSEIGRGLREALRVGTERVVVRLGQPDGFNLDPEVRIPLPRQLERARRVMARVGMDATLADLEIRLNRAAEIATPRAQSLFFAAIAELTLDDVLAIYNGPDDAATRYFESRMAAPLAAEMQPVVAESLADAGAVQLFDDVMTRYRAIPFAPEIEADLAGYVVEQAIDGIFFYLAREEAAIRADPAKRTTELLRRVFGR